MILASMRSHHRQAFGHGHLGIGALLMVLVLGAGCASKTVPLPTLESDNGGCRDVGLDATLAGDAHDPRVAWLLIQGKRADIIWPPGFSARFTPELEVLDHTGKVVFRSGDRISGACVVGPSEAIPVRFLIRPAGS